MGETRMVQTRGRSRLSDAICVVIAAILTALALCVPALALADEGATTTTTADPATSAYTPTAEDSGYVWTDKSVYTDGTDGITVSSEDELLVALSLLSSSTQGDSTTVTTPLDIVLLLDVSGSMDERMSGSTSRLAAMKTAVDKFIDQTQAANAALEKQGSDVRHQVSIVKIGGTKNTAVGDEMYWEKSFHYNYTQVVKTLSSCSTLDEATALKASVDGLKSGGATSIDYALELAKNNVLNSSRTGAKKVVILFTDGAPTHSSNYSSSVAASAVNTAKTLKDGGTLVYTIGIFNGANPSSTASNENLFMNAVSNNYPAAYAEENEGWFGPSWSIILGTPVTNKTFYKAASDASALEKVFTEIAQEITTPDPVSPVNAGSGSARSGVDFTDTLGSYMQVDDVKAIVYGGVTYTDKTVSADGTTYTFTADVTGNYANPTTMSLSAISITVAKSSDAKTGDTITVNVPTELVPFVYFSHDGTKVIGDASPLKVLYTVGLKGSAKDLLVSPDADMEAYIAANSDENGVSFYTNAHNGAANPGTTTAVCYPSTLNAYYYNADGSQKEIAQSAAKSENVTGTSGLVSSEAWDGATGVIAQLGNNGLLKKQQPVPVVAAITGTKTLTGRDSLEGEAFQFTFSPADEATQAAVDAGLLVLPEDMTATATGLTDGVAQDFVFGDMSFKAAGTYTFQVVESGIPEADENGITYDRSVYRVTVVISASPDCSTLEVTSVSAEVSKDGGQTYEEAEGPAFVNAYQAEGTTAVIAGTKTLEGSRELQAGDFSFTLAPAADYGDAVVMPESTTVENAADGSFSFDAIQFNAAGEYSFAVSEVVPAEGERIPGVTYDQTPQTVTVSVVDDTATGKLVATVAPATVSFTNSYQATSASVALGGTKVLEGRPLMADEFSFSLSAADEATSQAVAEGAVVMPESTTALNDANGTFAFGTATFTKAGVYNFKVTEVVPAEGQRVPGVTYDESEDILTVTVTDDTATGALVAVLTGAASFTNTYSADPVDATIAGTKTLVGRALQDGEFSVELDKDGVLYKTAVINGGAFSFTESYTLDDLAGTEMQPDFTRTAYFTYTLSEINPATGAQPDVTYDTSVYTVTVALTDDGVGHLSTAVTYSLNGEAVEAPVFTNTYRPSGEAYAELHATKSLTGRALVDGEFSFIVTDASQTTVATGSNNESGAVTFSKIAYDASSFTAEDENPDGTRSHSFWYSMTEVDNGHGGVTYDTTSYGVCVTLFDDGRGNLSTTVAYYLSPDAALDPSAVVFSNSYLIDDAEFTPTGVKTTSALDSTDLSGKVFSYQVTDEAGNLVATGTSGANDEIDFGSIKVSGLGEHVYTITETLGGQTSGGVTMDDAVYYLHLNLTDGGAGSYDISHWYTDASGQVIDGVPTFHNSYDGGDVTFNPSATKLFEGRTLVDGEFSFAIYDVTTDTAVSTGVNDADGNVEFGSIQYAYSRPEDTETDTDPAEKTDEGAEGVEGVEGAGTEDTESHEVIEQPEVSSETEEPIDATESGVPGEGTEGAEPAVEDVPTVVDNEEEFAESEAEGQTEGQGIFEPSIAIADDAGADPYQSGYDGSESVDPAEGSDPVEGGDPATNTPSVNSTDLGDHWYRIAEVIPSEAERNADGKLVYRGVVYDESYYLMKITVSDNSDGTVSAAVTEIERHDANGDVTPVTIAGANGMDNVTFSNSYKATVPAVVTIAGNKLVNGRDSIDGQFSFEVKDAASTTVATATVPAIAAGDSAAFVTTPITFSEVGQYTLTVSEVNGGQTIAGWTYDDETFDVTVNVSDNLDGTLSAVVTYPETGIWFGNAYKIVTPTSVTFEGTKVLTGRDAAQGEFTFAVTDASGSVVAAGSSSAASAGEAAGITFGSLSFSAEGEYTFCVSENHGGETIDGVTYDGSVFEVTVVVSDNGDGTCSAQVVYPEGGIVFQNAYTASAVTVTPVASKVMTGRALTDGEFLFTVVNAQTNAAASTGVNKADGSIAFDAITLTEPGTYEYTIREVAGTEANVTYDSKSYRMVVKVSDNLKGNLVAEVSYPDGGVTFTNTYTAPAPTPTPTPTPTPIPQTGDDGNGMTTAAVLGSLGALMLGAGLFVGLRRRANER